MSFVKTGCEKDEWNSEVAERSCVGQNGRELISTCEGTAFLLEVEETHDIRNSEGGINGVLVYFASSLAGSVHAVITRIVLRANRRLERDDVVEDVINSDDVRVGIGSELGRACREESGELLANERLGTHAGK